MVLATAGPGAQRCRRGGRRMLTPCFFASFGEVQPYKAYLPASARRMQRNRETASFGASALHSSAAPAGRPDRLRALDDRIQSSSPPRDRPGRQHQRPGCFLPLANRVRSAAMPLHLISIFPALSVAVPGLAQLAADTFSSLAGIHSFLLVPGTAATLAV